MRIFVLILLLSLLLGCQNRGTVDLEGLKARALAGDPAAGRTLIELLGEEGRESHARIYPFLLELGERGVPYLLEEVESADPMRREQVIAALGNLKVSRAVPQIARVLTDKTLKRRYVAAWALGEIGSPEGIPALLAVLDDEEAVVRRHAVRGLIRLNRLAVPDLLNYLAGASPTGAAGAVLALGDIGDSRAVEALLQHSEGPNRSEVFKALGKLKDNRAESVLIAGLNDPQWRQRMYAAMALGSSGTAAAVGPLQKALEDEVTVVREWAARSLAVISGEQVTYRNDRGEQVPPYSIYR